MKNKIENFSLIFFNYCNGVDVYLFLLENFLSK